MSDLARFFENKEPKSTEFFGVGYWMGRYHELLNEFNKQKNEIQELKNEVQSYRNILALTEHIEDG